jgi:hypothetical protein
MNMGINQEANKYSVMVHIAGLRHLLKSMNLPNCKEELEIFDNTLKNIEKELKENTSNEKMDVYINYLYKINDDIKDKLIQYVDTI